MRVLHVLAAFPRSPDDVIVPWLVELMQRLRPRGVISEVFTSAYRGGGNRELRGIPIHRFRYFPARWERLTHEEAAPDRMTRSWLFRLMPLCYLAAGAVGVWRLCRRERYDLVHVHWPLPHAVFGWIARRACGAPLVTTFYGVEIRWAKRSMPYLRRFLAWAARTSDRVIAISTYTARELTELAPAVPIQVIPYTVSLPADRGRAAAANDGACRILFVGRLVERKGVTYLLQALARLPGRIPARLVIVGDGPERSALEAQAHELGVSQRVEFRGWVSETDLRSAYAAATVFVLPAIIDRRGDTEGLGVVLLEAMNAGVPVIASEVGGITDIVMHGDTGLLVPPADADALVGALVRLVDDPHLAARLGERALQMLHQRFNWDVIAASWVRIYEDAVLLGRSTKMN